MKEGQYAHHIISHWYYSIRFVGAGSNHWPYYGRGASCTSCYCSYSHNSLVDICDLLAIPAFMTSSRIMVLPFEFIDTGCGIQNLMRLRD